MRISWNWLSQWVDLSDLNADGKGPEKLAALLTSRGLEVEELHRQGQGLDLVVAVQILERNPHPQADRLSLCKVTTGTGEPLEIVCGAQNMKAGDKVVLAQIGAHLPNGLKITQSKIRGVVSNGMLCSEEELKLKDKSEGILILPPDTKPGTPLAQILGLDDAILHFKLTANRGDCLSHLGMAREVAAALGQTIHRPAVPTLPEGKSPIALGLADGAAAGTDLTATGAEAPQFWGAVVEGVKVGPSPAWVMKRLESLGIRSINNVVDASNILMLELGQPVHAYDADKIQGGKLGVRLAQAGEDLPLLDGTSVKLAGTELVIADGARAIGLAGVMGGGNSEVTDGTTRVFLECAEFEPLRVRRSSSLHQKKTDAAHRFERGIDGTGQGYAIARLAALVTEWAGGKATSSVHKLALSRQPGKRDAWPAIDVAATYFNQFLGTDFTEAEIEQSLTRLECKIEKGAGSPWSVTPPAYRLDLSRAEDLAEEVARTLGYDRIPGTVPVLSSAPIPANSDAGAGALALLDRAKDALVDHGMLETVSYGFTSKTWLKQFGMEASAVLVNPLSEEYEAMVPSLLPGLIRAAGDGWRHHFGSEPLPIRLFELRPTFHAAPGAISAKGEMETGVEERWRLSFAMSGPRFARGLRKDLGEIDFYDVKAMLEGLFEEMGARGVRMQSLTTARNLTPVGSVGATISSLFHPGQSVEILAGNQSAGIMGLLHPGLERTLKCRAPLWLGEIDWTLLVKMARPESQPRTYRPWPQVPPMERDFALIVKRDVSAERIVQIALKAGRPLAKVAKVFDTYEGSQVAQGMTSVAVRVIFFEEGRSLQETEAEAAGALILEAWKKELGAELRG